MVVIFALLLIAAAVCFALAAFGVRVASVRREFSMVALGLLFWVLVPLIQLLVRL